MYIRNFLKLVAIRVLVCYNLGNKHLFGVLLVDFRCKIGYNVRVRVLSYPVSLSEPFYIYNFITKQGDYQTVFGKKQELTKELEEKLNMTQLQLEDMQMQLGAVQGFTQQMLPHFEAQIIAQGEMDKQLTKVVSQTYDTQEEAAESMKVLEQLAMELTSMRGQMEDEEQDKRRLQEVAGKQIEQMTAIIEENKNSIEPVTLLQETKTALKNDAEAMRMEVGHMQEYAKQMTVSALNCAIEAGRMGDVGKAFVEASEDVRMLSSAYERAAAATARQLDAMERRIRKLDEQTSALLRSNKDTNLSISRLSKNITQQDEICTRAAERHYLEKAAAISDYIKKISQSSHHIESLQQQTLSDIEHIGESFMSEQEARKGLEQLVEKMLGDMRG